jgi:hypothetical protein
MKKLFLFLVLLALTACAIPQTQYQPYAYTGGYSDFLTAPDEAVITFKGNGVTGADRVVEMAILRCAEVTLEHGYRYFVLTSATDMSTQSQFTTPGFANTYGSATGYGNFVSGYATTTYTAPQTLRFHKAALMASIKMSNNEKALAPFGMMTNGQKATPRDAAFLRGSLRQALGLKNG